MNLADRSCSFCIVALSLVLAGLVSAACGPGSNRSPPPSLEVDLDRYAGTWFQVFEGKDKDSRLFAEQEDVSKPCVGTTVEYTRKGPYVALKNSCFEGGFDGRQITITGQAFPVNRNNTRLKVRFDPWYLGAFLFDYWIMDVDEDYQVALLASPNSEGVSILSRSAKPDPVLLQRALDKAAELGFDPSASEPVPQKDEVTDGGM